MNEFLRFKYFLNYQWKAKTKYYLHSPFVYQFYLNVLEGTNDAQLTAIENLRKRLGQNNTLISLNDLGTRPARHVKLSTLESKVAVRPKYGRLLYQLVKYFQPVNILEIGTSIGLSSAYLALANKSSHIYSLEGSAPLIELAKVNHRSLNISNIDIIEGDFFQTLSGVLEKMEQIDLVFFDGNHRKEATLQYFDACLEKAHPESIFIFDDIYWNKEMSEAWTEIKAHSRITLALDVFQFGICFFKKEKLSKEEFVLRY